MVHKEFRLESGHIQQDDGCDRLVAAINAPVLAAAKHQPDVAQATEFLSNTRDVRLEGVGKSYASMASPDSCESAIRSDEYVSDTQLPDEGSEVRHLRSSASPSCPYEVVGCLPEDAGSSVAESLYSGNVALSESSGCRTMENSKAPQYGFPKWKKALARLSILRENETVQAWTTFTKHCRSAPPAVQNLITEFSSSASVPPCDLAKDGSEDFAFQFAHSEVPCSQDEVEDQIATGVSAGYPEFLCRLEVGADSLETWLGNVELVVLGRQDYSSLGKSFQMGKYSIHGLTIWTALVSIPKIRNSEKIFACWCRLVGRANSGFFEA